MDSEKGEEVLKVDEIKEQKKMESKNQENEEQISNNPISKENSVKKEIISWVIYLGVVILATFTIRNFVIVNAEIPSGSMENTIMIGDRIFANRLSYLFDEPARGDIIIFPFPDDETKTYIKRIIGTPGDTIEGKSGYVYINGEKLEEDYVTGLLEEDFGPYQVPEDSYFMMGDNRGDSADSRYWVNKFVSKDKILGEAVIRYYPFDSVKLIK